MTKLKVQTNKPERIQIGDVELGDIVVDEDDAPIMALNGIRTPQGKSQIVSLVSGTVFEVDNDTEFFKISGATLHIDR
ncbi:hypothetical protein VPHD51_0203 [Vibrio phage D51]